MAKNTADIVFKNGWIVTPSGVIEGGVAVVDGKIGAVGNDAFLPDAKRVVDLAGKHLLPGAIDPECHLGGHRDLAADFLRGVENLGHRLFSHADREHRRTGTGNSLSGERARHQLVQTPLADAGAMEIVLARVLFRRRQRLLGLSSRRQARRPGDRAAPL